MDFRPYAKKSWTCAHCDYLAPMDRSLAAVEGAGMRLVMACPRCSKPSIIRIRGLFRIRVETEAVPPPEFFAGFEDSPRPSPHPASSAFVSLACQDHTAGHGESGSRYNAESEGSSSGGDTEQDPTPEQGVSIDDLRGIASQKVDNGWLVTTEVACFWSAVRRLHGDSTLGLNWQEAIDAALAIYTAACTLTDASRRPLPCHELGDRALPDLTVMHRSVLPMDNSRLVEIHIGGRVANVVLDAGLIQPDPARDGERLSFMEIGDFLALDSAGKESGWSASHDMDLIWRTWRTLCAEGLRPRDVEQALSSIIHAAQLAGRGLGAPMTQRDLLVWLLAESATEVTMSDDRDSKVACIQRCLALAVEARVIWQSHAT